MDKTGGEVKNYHQELLEIKNEISGLKEVCQADVATLERSLARYDGVIEHLSTVNLPGYLQSVGTIQFIEKKMPVIKSKGMLIAIKRNAFVKVRRMLLRSIERDLANLNI
ncbi:hypothetical protein [Mucilaginibacter aquaedulcis]|uniref:hypothetical protein n=1 Tax=Mucilaginibacter aquaedulcis TaxID=1187081 RepID=UPI0025B2F4E2|nr:hypothetical protein [Mucilaginibacter aquaedulcis]MDN3551240.1 hypothetical protein [Mucilaginibacter aquaedulcis]